jgi:hypothetical protein
MAYHYCIQIVKVKVEPVKPRISVKPGHFSWIYATVKHHLGLWCDNNKTGSAYLFDPSKAK